MFYLIINEQIRKYIDMIKDKHFGCKKYCPLQIIALDEMELLRKELKKININLSNEEYSALLKSTESKYFHTIHTCITPEEEKKREEQRKMEEIKQQSKNDKNLKKNMKTEEAKKKHEDEDEVYQKKQLKKKRNGKTIIKNGLSLLISFFVIVLGAYYFGKYFFKLNDSNTLNLVIVITIIVLLSEICLILLSIHKEDLKIQESGIQYGRNIYYGQESFAYKFNKSYRNRVDNKYDRRFKKKRE